MKTIDEAAKEYANEAYPKIGLHEDWIDDGYDEGYKDAKSRLSIGDFKAGVEFAQIWIDISEEMPEVGEQILTKNGNSIGLSLPLTMWDIKDITEFATHWRPIELK